VEFTLLYTVHALLVMPIYPIPAYIRSTRVLCVLYNRTYRLSRAGLSDGDMPTTSFLCSNHTKMKLQM